MAKAVQVYVYVRNWKDADREARQRRKKRKKSHKLIKT